MVKAGDVVKVRVVEVDVARKRIGLSMRKDDGAATRRRSPRRRTPRRPQAPASAKPTAARAAGRDRELRRGLAGGDEGAIAPVQASGGR